MTQIVMPRLSDSMEVGTIVRWLKGDGERVAQGDGIAEIESDKTTETHESPASGVLRIGAQEGDTLPVGAVIGSIEPPARTGDGAPAAGEPVAPRGTATTTEPPRAQAQYARRVAESRATIPTITVRASVDMTLAEELRETLHGAAGGDVPSLEDLLVKAAGLALAEHAKLNGAYRDGRFEQYGRVNVGIVVPTSGAPVTATIFDADREPLARIAAHTRELADRARSGTIAAPELAGGTFTVSALTTHGVRSLEAVVTPGQAATLSAGEVEARPVVRDGQVVVRRMLDVELTCDHRIVYAHEAAAFLARIRAILEAPLALTI